MKLMKTMAMLTAAATLLAGTPVMAGEAVDASDFKVGFIMLHDENSTYDLNFINAAKAACEKLGVPYELKTNIPEGQEWSSSAIPRAPRHIPKGLTTSTMHLLPSMKAVSLPASQQA